MTIPNLHTQIHEICCQVRMMIVVETVWLSVFFPSSSSFALTPVLFDALFSVQSNQSYLYNVLIQFHFRNVEKTQSSRIDRNYERGKEQMNAKNRNNACQVNIHIVFIEESFSHMISKCVKWMKIIFFLLFLWHFTIAFVLWSTEYTRHHSIHS